MTQSPFARSLVASVCVAGTIFTATAIPLALFKSKVVNVEFQNRPVFSSELQSLAAPYLALSGSFSAAVGFGVFGLLGWRCSTRKSIRSQSSQSELMNELMTYQAELERIKFSEARLRAQDLGSFLQAEPISQLARSTPTDRMSDRIEESSQPTNSLASDPATLIEQTSQHNEHAKRIATANGHSNGFAPDLSGHNPSENHEAFDQLLSQLHRLSKQVEELRGRTSDDLAA